MVIVNDSPWGSCLSVTALRLLRAFIASGVRVDAVYFRGEGVYNARPVQAVDHGTPDLYESWRELSQAHGIPLLLCKSASRRRFDCDPGGGFRSVGLAEVVERMGACDRVLTF